MIKVARKKHYKVTLLFFWLNDVNLAIKESGKNNNRRWASYTRRPKGIKMELLSLMRKFLKN